MKNLLISLIFILLTSTSYAQRGCLNTPASVSLTNSNLEEVIFQLCDDGNTDYLVLTQCYSESSVTKTIPNAEVGNYLLKGIRIALFTTDNSKFHLKFVNEERVADTLDECDEYITYTYYEVSRSRLRLILFGTVESIEIVGDNNIQFFEVTYPQAVELYQMVYTYFRWKKWEN